MAYDMRFTEQHVAEQLDEPVREARALAHKLGLEPYPVNYWVVDYDEMNELIAYGGFQKRYPHWRWGMQYDRQRKQSQYTGGKAFEIVNNDNPSNAFLQESNTITDQKAVITHVEGHADFFANNQEFRKFSDNPNAAALLARHSDTIEDYMTDPDIDRQAVERWIDHLLCLEDNIDQHQEFDWQATLEDKTDDDDTGKALQDKIEELEIGDDVKQQVFDDDWLDAQQPDDETVSFPDEPEEDLLAFLYAHGKQYDDDAEKAIEMEDWQRDIIEIIRRESYYFAPQKLTKVMNEGWAAYWESMMMGEELFAGDDEFITYADHQAAVLNSPGMNPYKLGKELWEYIENTENRREVVEKLLRVDGITWQNFHDKVDFDAVRETLAPPAALDTITPDTLDEVASLPDEYVDDEALDAAQAGEIDVGTYPWKVLTYEGLAHRHFSLCKPQNRSFIADISQQQLEQRARYVFDESRYSTVEAALADVEYTAGWDKMREVRETHNDVNFISTFLTQEFVTKNNYFTYEYSHAGDEHRVSSTDYEDVKNKLLLQFTNFGKPRVAVYDGNYANRNELLLGHHYNGIMLDLGQAKRVLERMFRLWGRPVNLMTVVKEIDEDELEDARRRGEEPDPDEHGKLIRYDGDEFELEDLPWEDVEDIVSDAVDYDSTPDEWPARRGFPP